MLSRSHFFVASCITALTITLLILLSACGGSSHSTTTTTGNSGTTGTSNSGTGSAGTGSSNMGSTGSGTGTSNSSSSVAYAYSSNGSSILGYGVNADGSLTPVPGSPYSVSTQAGQSPQGALVTNGANLYAIASGGTNVDVMAINSNDGSLSQGSASSVITGDPNTGDMADSLSLDATGSFLYAVVGLSDLDSGINVFATSGFTHQQFLAAGAVAASSLVFSADNKFAYTYACAARTEGVFGYARGSDGTLAGLSLSNVTPPVSSPGTSYCPIGIAASAAGYLAIAWTPFQYASSATVGNQTYVGAYKINGDGSLTLVSNSNVTTASASSLVLNFDPTGTYLAVAGNGGVQTYTLSSGGTLTAVAPPSNAGVNFTAVAWDKSNHVFATSSSQLYVFTSSNATLSPASGSPYTGGAALAVLPLK